MAQGGPRALRGAGRWRRALAAAHAIGALFAAVSSGVQGGAGAQRQLAAQAGQLRVRGLHHVEVRTRQPHLPDRVPCGVAPPGPHGRGGQIVVAGGDQRQRAVQAARAVVARAFMHREDGAQHRQQVGPGFRVVEQVGCRFLRTAREETVC